MTSAWYSKDTLRNETRNFLISIPCFPWLVYTLTPSIYTHYYLTSSNLPFNTKTTKKFPAENKITENLRMYSVTWHITFSEFISPHQRAEIFLWFELLLAVGHLVNLLAARDSQHPHNASAGGDQRDTVNEAGGIISTPSQSGLLPAPIILVGNKCDLVNPDFLVASHIEPIMNEFPNIETFVACSAKDVSNVSEVFHYAQKDVLHPSSPLFNYESNELTITAVRALYRIFRLSDLNNDG